MSTHYFIGIRIPADIAQHIAQAKDSWELKTHKRKTPAVDMHITLLFIGEDRFGELPEIVDRLSDIRQGKFQLELAGVKTFGNPETPRIVYAALKDSPELMKLQACVKQRLDTLQLTTDPKPFVPHITLASRWDGGIFTEGLQLDKLKFSVESFSLFRIHPRENPRYVEVQTYPLKSEG